MVKCVSLADETGWSNVNWHSIKGRLARATARGSMRRLSKYSAACGGMSGIRLDGAEGRA